jgi:actin-related protein
MQREFETQLQQQQEKISAFEALQDQQQQEMAEQKALAKQASKEKLSEIQREFVNQLQKKEKQIANISNQFAANPAQKAPAEKQKPELTSAEKKAMQKKEMKEFMTTLKQLEAQEKKAKQQKLQTNNIANRIVAGPIKRIASTINPSKIIPYENLDHVFKNLSIDGVYRFGNLGKQSDLIIITTGPEPIAQLKSRYWVELDVWKNTYRNLKNVRIEDDKLFSTEYIGEFVFYEKRGELIKGLRIQKSGAGNLGSDSDVGKRVGSIAEYYEGDYPYTSTRILSKLEIENMSSRSELKLMRNEIFARYGHKFEPNGRMDQHFTNKNWYQPQHEDVTAFLTDIEIKNVNQIKNTEVEVIEAINFLKGFAN